MAVDFSVVGVFYKTRVDLSQVRGNTVGDIMQYLYRADPNFYYTSIVFDQNTIVNSIGINHPTPFQGRTGITYPVGFYRLAQSFTDPTPNPYSVWQYYLADQNGIRQPSVGDRSFTQAPVQDGWSIVWRLVTICNAPTSLARRMRKLVTPDVQASLGMT